MNRRLASSSLLFALAALAVGQVNATAAITSFVSGLSMPAPTATAVQSKLLSNTATLQPVLNGEDIVSTVITELACYTAQMALGASVVHTSDNETEDDGTWSDACWATPSCSILPTSDKDVSLALKIITFFRTKFAVRSGGHSPNPGFSSVSQPGILIDLQLLDEISVNSDASVVSLGPGNRWGAVYPALAPYEVSVVGGRINDVGVGGLILGGGYFHLSGEYGLAADNAQNFHIVLADGAIVDANASENSDLFWALKGGGANFGIVTRYDLYTIPAFNIWYEVFIYSTDQASDVLDAFAQWQEDGASDSKSTVAMVISLEDITVGLLYSEPAIQPAAFAPFYNLTPEVVALPPTNGTVPDLMELFGNTGSTAAERHDYRSASSTVNSELYNEVYSFWLEQATAVYQQTGANQTFVLQPVTVNLIDAGNARGGNPLGLPRQNMQFWTTLIDWADDADDDLVRSVSINTTEKWQSLGEELGAAGNFVYMNDASRDQNPLSTYNSTNLAKLNVIAKKYDPTQVFQTLQNGGFLLKSS